MFSYFISYSNKITVFFICSPDIKDSSYAPSCFQPLQDFSLRMFPLTIPISKTGEVDMHINKI
jgi:hypothetical protein